MGLFQQSVLNKYLKEINREGVRAAWLTFRKHFLDAQIQANIRDLKEEEYQGGFLDDLFCKILGYTLNPQANYNLVLEKKSVTDSTKSDGAILDGGSVIAVIELKDTGTTDLEKVTTQAFGYKHKHRNCKYVITSNFEKLRFYIQDSVNFIEFNLFELSETEFNLLWLCLTKQSLLSDLPLKISEQSLIEEGIITQKLYLDYSDFKRKLFDSILALNPQHEKLELFKKTQKLIDRFLFILFAEDRQLLPPNFIINIIKDWKQLEKLRIDQSLYQRFILYFNDLNEGNSKEDIFAYNGGLFEPDDILDNIRADDSILESGILKLSAYDYNTDIDVNILGHIFEHSLVEIEEIQAQLAGEGVVLSRTRRKKEGVFYTPRYITKYMVESSLRPLVDKKRGELQIIEEVFIPQKFKTTDAEAKRKKKLLGSLDKYSEWLLSLTICDPACGSGAFLNAALEFLIAEHRYVDELTKKTLGYSLPLNWTPNDILEHNLYGVDINEEAVEIARLSLWLRTASKERKLCSLSQNIKCGNSLTEDKGIAGEKAFIWKEEFKEIFDKGKGFDAVIGNPPYVDIKALPASLVDYYFSKYSSANNRINLFALFIERALRLIKPGGYFSFIIPSALLSQESYKKIRELLLTDTTLREIVRLPNESFGGSAGDVKVDTIILTFEVSRDPKSVRIIIYEGFDRITEISTNNADQIIFADQKSWSNDKDAVFRINVNDSITKLLSRIEKDCQPLVNCADFSLGLTPYDKYKGHTKEQIEGRAFHAAFKKDDTYKKLLAGNDVSRYQVKWNGAEWISYGPWLGAARGQRFFTDKRIIVKQIIDWTDKRIWAAITEEELYNTQNAFNLIPLDGYVTEYLVALLNSKLISFYHRKKYLEEFKDRFQKILIKDAKLFPVKKIDRGRQESFISGVNQMVSLTAESETIREKFLRLIEARFDGIKIGQILWQWPDLTFKQLLKELRRQKISLNITAENDLLIFFESEKQRFQNLGTQVSNLDRQIDEMIYKIYELTLEQIEVIESAFAKNEEIVS